MSLEYNQKDKDKYPVHKCLKSIISKKMIITFIDDSVLELDDVLEFSQSMYHFTVIRRVSGEEDLCKGYSFPKDIIRSVQRFVLFAGEYAPIRLDTKRLRIKDRSNKEEASNDDGI